MIQLQAEGIANPSDLMEFDKDALKQLTENLSSSGGRIPNPDLNAQAGSTMPRLPHRFRAKSQKRLLAVQNIVCFYKAVN